MFENYYEIEKMMQACVEDTLLRAKQDNLAQMVKYRKKARRCRVSLISLVNHNIRLKS